MVPAKEDNGMSDKLVVEEGGTEPIQLGHLQLDERIRMGAPPDQIKFKLLSPPQHGSLLLISIGFSQPSPIGPSQAFSFADVLAQRLFYRHDGSESLSDSVDLKLLDFDSGFTVRFSPSPPGSVSIPVEIVPQNDAPSLQFGPKGPILHVEPGSRVQLSAESHLRVADPDSVPERVWIHVEEISANLDLVDRFGARLRRFSLAELLHGDVFLLAEDENWRNREGYLNLIARDELGAQSMPLTIHVTFSPLKLVLDRNTGIRLLQQTSQLIESSHLHFHCAPSQSASSSATKLPLRDLPIRFSVVDQPKFGVVECLADPLGQFRRWALCSTFLQSDIEALRVRYRHTNPNRTTLADGFDFQVHCVDSSSPIQLFQIDFVTLSIRVFVQEPLRLNETDQRVLSRRNLLATVFPHNFQPDQLVFNILEAPKLGMLLRHVPETGKQRRIGVNSNFTQQHIDDGFVSYKLHFAPFSVLNDFFTFRLLTPAGNSDETFRFEMVYLPGGNIGAIHLLNRTLIVPQGGIQQISNGTLWVESGDGGSQFTFRMALGPLNGHLALLGEQYGYEKLELDGRFNSADIVGQRLFYEHSDDQSRSDRVFLLAESELRDPGGGKGHTPIAVWLHISIVPNNSHAPQLLQDMFGATLTRQEINVLQNDERVLWPSDLPWLDLDDDVDWPSPDQSQLFPVAKSRNPLTFHLMDPTISRDFVICAKTAPEIPLRDFMDSQLRNGELLLRHLGGAREHTVLRYVVSDGRHSTPALLALSASSPSPFVRLSTPPLITLLLPHTLSPRLHRLQYLLSPAHFRAETNANSQDIRFEVNTLIRTPFVQLKGDGSFQTANTFTQKDIFANKIFVEFGNESGDNPNERAVLLKLIVIDEKGRTISENEQVVVIKFTTDNEEENASPISIALATQGADETGLTVPQGGSCPIESGIARFIQANGEFGHNFVAKYHVIRGPEHGKIIFQRLKRDSAGTSANYNIPIASFDQSLISSSGSIQYVHNSPVMSSNSDEQIGKDEFQVNITVQRWRRRRTAQDERDGTEGDFFIQLGPFSVPVQILPGGIPLQLITPALITLPPPSPSDPNQNTKGIPLEDHFLRLWLDPNMSLDPAHLDYRLVQKSPSLTLVNRQTGQPIANAFSHSQLLSGDILLMPDGHSKEEKASLTLRACANSFPMARCSQPAELRVRLPIAVEVPVLVRNIPLELKLSQKDGPITSDNLQILHPKKMPSELHFVVWQQNGGRLLRKGLPNSNVSTFTQQELNQGQIWFELDLINSTNRHQMGFNFLITDGQNQRGPDWFSVNMKDEASETENSKIDATQPTTRSSSTSTTELKTWTDGELPRLEKNAKLSAAPGIPSPIGPEFLKAVARTAPSKILFHLTKPPLHGRLVLNGSEGRLEGFSQADIDSGRLSYVSQPDIGVWSHRDDFHFRVEVMDMTGTGKKDNGDGAEHRFRVDISYANLAGKALDQMIPRRLIRISPGGSVALNATHLNLTSLATRAEDELFVKLWSESKLGWMERVDEALGLVTGATLARIEKDEDEEEEEGEEERKNGKKPNSQWRLPLSADQLATGNFLVYHHNSSNNGSENEDEFMLMVYSGREPNRGLKLSMAVRVEAYGDKKLRVDRFPRSLSLLSGGSMALSPADFHCSHPSASSSQILFTVSQSATPRMIRISLNNQSLSGQFSQADVDGGAVVVEHMPGGNDVAKWELVGFQMARAGQNDGQGHSRVLIVRIEPLALHLKNHSEIGIAQGRTYVLLNRAHLGAESNGDRARIMYNVTRLPENGTLYWVDGEKEAYSFSQQNIDQGDVLYAQMNMDAFQDSFEFVLSNDEMELLPKLASIRVQPVFQPQRFLTNSRTVTQLGLLQLNASALEGSSPRFLVVQPPQHGRLFLHPNPNQSVLFFTHSDVVAGRLFFHAFEVLKRVTDHVLLELQSDNVQPSRLVWTIEIRPIEENADLIRTGKVLNIGGEGGETEETAKKSKEFGWRDPALISPPPPDMNYHFPIAILVAVVALVIGILLCRRKSHESRRGSTSDDASEQKKVATKLERGGTSTALKSSFNRGKNGTMGTGKAYEGSKMPFGATSSSGNAPRTFGVATALNEMRLGGISTGFAGTGGANLLDSMVYATLNNRQSREPTRHQNGDPSPGGSSAPANGSSGNSSAENGTFRPSAPLFHPSTSVLSPITLPTSLTSGPCSISAVIPTFQPPPRRQTSPSRRIPTITLPSSSSSRSESRERQQILASAAVAAMASKGHRRSLEPERSQRRGSGESRGSREETEGGGEGGVKNEFWV